MLDRKKRREIVRVKKILLVAYLGLLAVSGIWKVWMPLDIPPRENQETAILGMSDSGSDGVRIRYLDTITEGEKELPVLVLLHGSPMASEVFDKMVPLFQDRFRVVVPDLPGFGRSEREVEDYSIAAHADYLASLLSFLEVEQCHVFGYSMGGGVALEYSVRYPDKVRSLVLASSIGLQDYELLGDYTLNHALHAAQLFCIWSIDWLVPHFGWLDRMLINTRYARNFYDTDQRPLRHALEQWSKPVLLIHGVDDGLVSIETAKAHERLLPQAQASYFEGEGHLLIVNRSADVSERVARFVSEVESGTAQTRDDFPHNSASFDELPRRSGWVMATLLGVATFASEDLACIGGGLLASRGAISLQLAILGCLLGIFVGDFAIYFMGRFLGKPAIDLPVIRSVLKKERVERCARWIDEKGVALIVSTRFVPGSRVPTYFAAGVLRANPLKFGFGLFVASAIWTPAIVGLSFVLGGQFIDFFEVNEGWALLGLLVSALLILLLARVGVSLATWRGRRLLYSRFKRITRWEFWPMWFFYPPVVVFLLWKMLRSRSVTLLTTVNPCMPESGLVYESKGGILSHLEKHGSPVGRFRIIPKDWDLGRKQDCIETFKTEYDLDYPFAIKADVGQRGEGVSIVKSKEESDGVFEDHDEDLILQEFLPGREFGVFYYRIPGAKEGHVYSVTDKRFVSVTGDGSSTLEELILRDERAVCMARFYLDAHQRSLDHVIPRGVVFPLTELGTHCRGALFLDGARFITPALERSMDEMSRGVDGFHFGRYDIRVPSEEDLMNGQNIRIIELNGLTSESTNIYDPKHSLWFAYKTLFKQYNIAFEIAQKSVSLGNRPSGLASIVRLCWRYFLGKGPAD